MTAVIKVVTSYSSPGDRVLLVEPAAGVLIAREAGAVVCDADGKSHSFTSKETIAICPGIASNL
ncbi:hypothetical protein ACFQ1S_37440, partial [Kibdelosporangium lantanae]